jgi:hypothetical protein
MPGEQPLLLQTDNGPTVRWKGISLYPSDNPIEYARRRARVFSPLPRSIVFVPSVGLGHGLADLLQKLPDGCAILCVEAHQEIMGLALQQGLPADPRLTIIRADNAAAVEPVLEGLGPGRFRRVVQLSLSGGYRLAAEMYADCLHRLEERLRLYWQNRLTLIALGSLQVRNILSNLALLPGAKDFSSLSSPSPVVVAGAGPSLEGCLPMLARLRDRYLLISVDTALPVLAAHGVTPDIVIALEAQVANLQDFIAAGETHTLLASDLSSYPAINRRFPGKLFFFSSCFAPLLIFERLRESGLLPTPFPAFGSVGVAAVHAALAISASDIFLAGLDFSFPGFLTHARGAPSHLLTLEKATRLRPVGLDAYQALAARSLILVKDKNGGAVATDRVMRSYRDNLDARLSNARGRAFDIGSLGLDLGIRKVEPAEAEERIAGGAETGRSLEVDPRSDFRAEALVDFISHETRLLRDAAARMRESARGGGVPSGSRELLRQVDYTWLHFPDESDLDHPERSFLARAAVAASWYADRIDRLGSIL